MAREWKMTNDNKLYIVACSIPYRTGRRWNRAFGPFKSYSEARIFSKTVASPTGPNAEYYSKEFLESIDVKIMPLWEMLDA